MILAMLLPLILISDSENLNLHLRDYFDEIQSAISIGAAEWKIQNLCVWNDLILPREALASLGADVQSIEDAEADLEAAEFAAVLSKIAILFFHLD